MDAHWRNTVQSAGHRAPEGRWLPDSIHQAVMGTAVSVALARLDAELVPGDHLDLMNLADAGPVAYHRALTHCRVLYSASSAAFAEREIFAITHYLETQPLRDLLLERLASRH